MGRKKKLTEAELENTQVGLTIENESEMEAEEAELLAEPDTEKEETVAETSEVELEAGEASTESAPEEAPKPRRQRKPRKPRAPKVEAAAEVATVPEVAGPSENFEVKLREELAVAQVTLDKTMENVAKQWAAINEMSTTISANFEKLNQSTRPQGAPIDPLETADLIRPQAPQTLLITKFATAASVVAVLLSLVSLSLSQSARQTALAMESGEISRRNALATRESTPAPKHFPAAKDLTKDSSTDMMKSGTPWVKRTRR